MFNAFLLYLAGKLASGQFIPSLQASLQALTVQTLSKCYGWGDALTQWCSNCECIGMPWGATQFLTQWVWVRPEKLHPQQVSRWC